MKLFFRSLFFFVGALLVLAAVALVATWAPDKPVDELKPRWAQPPSQFIAIDGMQVHLRDEGPRGDPLPIVLVHGTSASLHTWEGWAAALRGQRRVIRFDLPGFALTGPNRQDDYSVEAYVYFVTQLVDLYRDMTLRAGNRRALGRRMDQGYTGDAAGLKTLTMPTLILWGGRDRLIPLEFGQRFARDIAGSRLVVFNDLGHVPHEEDPARTVAVVKMFLGL